VQKMMDYLYCLDYDGKVHVNEKGQTHSGPPDSSTSALLLLPIEMHAMAEKYDVQGLKENSALKFRQALCGINGANWTAADALEIIQTVYESTRPGDVDIRSIITSFVFKNLTVLMTHDAFRGLLTDHPDFAYNVLNRCSQAALLGNCEYCARPSVYCAAAAPGCTNTRRSQEFVKRRMEDQIRIEGPMPYLRLDKSLERPSMPVANLS